MTTDVTTISVSAISTPKLHDLCLFFFYLSLLSLVPSGVRNTKDETSPSLDFVILDCKLLPFYAYATGASEYLSWDIGISKYVVTGTKGTI